jgi:chromatin assembly factor 1 subunit A
MTKFTAIRVLIRPWPGRLQSILSGLDMLRVRPPRHALYKTYNSNSIREVMSRLTEAEVAGEDGLVRSLLSQLRERTTFPGKVFIFHEDARPGYFGTWTHSSKCVGARTPFAKDLIAVDYSYDSGEEWEDEGTADADDVVGDDDDEPMDEEADSDLDSWLVDDDDISVSVGDLDSMPPELPETSFSPPKRKVQTEDKKNGKKRKVVIPLVPFAKGPCLESAIGRCDYEPFKAYRIQLLNGTHYIAQVQISNLRCC